MTISAQTVQTVSTTTRAVDVRDALTACILSAGKDMTLPVLAAVQIVKNADTLVFTSTDRYRLTTATIRLDSAAAESPDFTALLPVADAKRIVAMLPKRPTRGTSAMPVEIRLTDGMLTVGTFDGDMSARVLDAEYPRVASIIAGTEGEHAGASRIGFNPAQMADLCKMPGRSKNEAIALEITDHRKPMRTTWGDADAVEYLHILMPVRFPGA